MCKWEKLMREATSNVERDEVTNLWLYENDPYYRDITKNKQATMEYPYHTPDITKRVMRNEVSESQLNVVGTLEAKAKGIAENKVI